MDDESVVNSNTESSPIRPSFANGAAVIEEASAPADNDRTIEMHADNEMVTHQTEVTIGQLIDDDAVFC